MLKDQAELSVERVPKKADNDTGMDQVQIVLYTTTTGPAPFSVKSWK